MVERILLLVGTKKGLFLLESTDGRKNWSQSGPFCETWPIQHAICDPASGAIFAAGGNEWVGPAVWKSKDFGRSWSHSSAGLAYEPGMTPIKSAWSLAVRDGELLVGVEPAGLFRSEDGGTSFQHVEGLTNHPTREDWQPGGGGLILHTIVPDRSDPLSLYVAISAVGVFHSADGGKSWEPRNRGTRSDYMPPDQRYPEWGQCVHCVVMAPGNPRRLFQQNHCGMYRSDDGGASWISVEAGLPSSFGFPTAAHPRDDDTFFVAPLNGDIVGRFMPDGRAAIWRTRDAGRTWADCRKGLPQQNAYFGILRQAMAVDTQNPAGVYVGTSSGTIYASADEGDSFAAIASHLPTISSVETAIVRA